MFTIPYKRTYLEAYKQYWEKNDTKRTPLTARTLFTDKSSWGDCKKYIVTDHSEF